MDDKEILSKALNYYFNCDVSRNKPITIREYLELLLLTLWDDQEGFSGKRPFGNSGWEYDLYQPLVKGGFIDGELDSEGYIYKINKVEAHAFVRDLIVEVFKLPKK